MPDFRFINSRPVDLREVEEIAGKIQRRKTAKEVEQAESETTCTDDFDAQYTQKKLDDLRLFAALTSKNKLEPWQKHFLELALRAKKAGQTLNIPRHSHRKVVGKLYVEIKAFDVMRDLAQSEFEKAVALCIEFSGSIYSITPSVNYYLDRAVFFAQLSQQTNNLVHLNKAYKRAYLVCMVVKYFLKDKHSNLEPSARLITAMRKGIYL